MKTLYLIDASGYLYRSYHAIQGMTNAHGESTNALFGFIRSIQRLMKDFPIEYMAAVFDGPRSLEKREALYADYKAHRMEMPKDLRYQIDRAQSFCKLIGIPYLVVEGVEADDTLGSVAKWGEKQGAKLFLCTSDKDMAQLVTSHVKILNTFKENQVIGPDEVQQLYGVSPSQMVDWLAMTGDASDNIPGLPGIGPKTATALLQQFGTLDELLNHPEQLTGKKRETFQKYGEQARLCRQLVVIHTDVPFPQDSTFFRLGQPDLGALKAFYADMNFNSLLRGLADEQPRGSEEQGEVYYHLVDSEASLQKLMTRLQGKTEICLDLVTVGTRPLQAELIGIGLGVVEGEAWYVPVVSKSVLDALMPLFENPAIGFYGHNIKYGVEVLSHYGIHIAKICFDTLLASYILDSHQRRHSLEELALGTLGKTKIRLEELIGRGKQQKSLRDVPLDQVCRYCCENVDDICRLKQHLGHLLVSTTHSQGSVFYEIELPLLPVLVRMEQQGVFLNADYLRSVGEEVIGQLKQIQGEVYLLAGETFNLNSPRQLGEILFTKLGIKPPRKTATGLSTNAEVLQSLAEEYPLAGKVLEYRSLEKLRSTYVEALLQEIDPRTGRIHPNFNQSIAATGRLSCQDPNLQNIPVRTKEGRRIRAAFCPQKKGWSYVSADYSQIELRILAHLSEDDELLDAFHRGQDVHARTAASIFGLSLDQVTPEQRHQAKAVNFGVIYGQQAFGLARGVGIDVKSAALFIDLYFKRYPKVHAYIEQAIAQARKTGRAITMTGRERKIPEINSHNGSLRMAAERLAINTPLQGSAADLIKIAMIAIDERLRREGKKSLMILQIHDELLFEVPHDEIDWLSATVRELMQSAMILHVPLIVDIKVGNNWAEC